MKNIFLFIRRFSTVLLFLILQGIAIWMLFTYKRFHRARGMGVASEITGWFNSRYNTVEDFFRMKEENRRLLRMNDSLLNLMSGNFIPIDTSSYLGRDSIPFDSAGHFRHWRWRPAQVIYTTVNSPNNYLQINRGSNHGIGDNMGVFSSEGALVGKVVNVGANYSQVMSLLHSLNKVSVLVRRTGSAGTLEWDGANPRMLTLNNVSRSDSVVRGDTVVTGNLSLSYPSGYHVGTIDQVIKDNSSSFLILKVRPAVNFATIQQVMVVENLQMDEQRDLMAETVRKVGTGK